MHKGSEGRKRIRGKGKRSRKGCEGRSRIRYEKEEGVQGGCVGGGVGSDVGKRGGSSTITRYLPKKQMGGSLVKIN